MFTYGVIGGYGSNASLEFQNKLFKKAIEKGAKEDEDFPHYVLAHIPKEVINSEGTQVNRDAWREALNKLNLHLQHTDETFLLCNSLHYDIGMIRNQLDRTKFISLLSITEAKASETDAKRLILASTFSKHHALYGDHNEDNYYYNVEQLINNAVHDDVKQEYIAEAIQYAEANNYDLIIFGCTELTLYTEMMQELTEIPYVDSVEEAVNYILGRRNLYESL